MTVSNIPSTKLLINKTNINSAPRLKEIRHSSAEAPTVLPIFEDREERVTVGRMSVCIESEKRGTKTSRFHVERAVSFSYVDCAIAGEITTVRCLIQKKIKKKTLEAIPDRNLLLGQSFG